MLVDALNDPRWSAFKSTLENYDSIVQNQDRSKLDCEVPSELSNAILAKIEFRFVVRNGIARLSTEAEKNTLSSAEIASVFGGEIIEEILEFGSASVSNSTHGRG